MGELSGRLLEAIQIFVAKTRKKVSKISIDAPSFVTTGMYGLSEQANVRLTSSPEKWPMVSELVQDMEDERDKGETAAKSKILAMELRLLQAENKIIEMYLRKAV